MFAVYAGSFICAFDPKSNDVFAIPGHKVCDGFRDWFDGRDEQGCRTFNTKHNYKLICYLKWPLYSDHLTSLFNDKPILAD